MRNRSFSFLSFFYLLGQPNASPFLLIDLKFLLLPLTSALFVSPLLLDLASFFHTSPILCTGGRKQTRVRASKWVIQLLFSFVFFFQFFPLNLHFKSTMLKTNHCGRWLHGIDNANNNLS